MDNRVDCGVTHELCELSRGAGCGEVELKVGRTGNAVPQPANEIVNDDGSVAAPDEEAADVSADVAGASSHKYTHDISLRGGEPK
jgi:hypothetical protein